MPDAPQKSALGGDQFVLVSGSKLQGFLGFSLISLQIITHFFRNKKHLQVVLGNFLIFFQDRLN